MRLAGTKLAANHQYRGFGDQLYDLSGQRPSLDLNFANSKSLVDATTGQNLVTFTRASSGTYVDSQGVIRTAVTNVQLRSEEFDNANYTRTGILAFGSGSVANAITAPNGTVTADLITEDTSTGRHRLLPIGQAVVSGLSYTYSVYAKSTNRNLFLNCDALFNARAAFNLQTGAVTTGNGSAVITPVGDDWYRCSVTGTASSTKTDSFYIQIQTGTTDANYIGDGTSGIYIWGAQLEQSSTVGEYIPTTSTINSAPRFDHNPTTGESLGLLVEEQRTNLAIASQSFADAAYGLFDISLSSSTEIAPDGSASAGLLLETTTTASHAIGRSTPAGNITSVAATTYTFSVFVKNAGRNFLQITANTGQVTNNPRANYDLSTNTLGTVDASATASITPYANGWKRLSFTVTASGTVLRFLVGTISSSTAARFESFAGDITKGFYIWGYSAEAGASPTSYIPTTTATATRSADVASITGSNFSSWYRQDEGTVFTDTVNRETYPGANVFPYILQIDGGTNDNRISYDNSVLSNGYRYNLPCQSGGVSQGELNQFGFASGAARWASAFRTNDFALAINLAPSVVSTRTSGTLPNVMTQLRIGFGFGKQFTGTIRRLTYFPVRLANETLQRITQ